MTSVDKDMQKLKLFTLLVVLVQPFRKTVWQFLKMLKLPYDPEIPLPGTQEK